MKKSILCSLFMIIASISVICGATYALFVSGSQTNIAVTSGIVDVKAEIENLKLFSGKWADDEYEDELQGTTFKNGGTATLIQNSLTLDRITPTDKVTFEIKVTNKSNVVAKYRTIVLCNEGFELFDELKIEIDDEEYSDLVAVSPWEMLSPETKTVVFQVTIALPVETGNEFQGLTTKMSFNFEAVQGNAGDDESSPYLAIVRNVEQLQEALEDSTIKHIKLMNGVYETRLHITRDVVIFGESQTGVIIKDKVLTTGTPNVANYFIPKIAGDTTSSIAYGYVVAAEKCNVAIGNLTIQGERSNFMLKPFAAPNADKIPYNTGMLVLSANLYANKLIVKDIMKTVLDGAQNGCAVYVATDLPGKTIVMKNSVITNFQKGAICVRSGVENAKFIGNEIFGAGLQYEISQNAIQVGCPSTIINNHIEGLVLYYYVQSLKDAEGQSTGIYLADATNATKWEDLIISGNTFKNVDNNMAQYIYAKGGNPEQSIIREAGVYDSVARQYVGDSAYLVDIKNTIKLIESIGTVTTASGPAITTATLARNELDASVVHLLGKYGTKLDTAISVFATL